MHSDLFCCIIVLSLLCRHTSPGYRRLLPWEWRGLLSGWSQQWTGQPASYLRGHNTLGICVRCSTETPRSNWTTGCDTIPPLSSTLYCTGSGCKTDSVSDLQLPPQDHQYWILSRNCASNLFAVVSVTILTFWQLSWCRALHSMTGKLSCPRTASPPGCFRLEWSVSLPDPQFYLGKTYRVAYAICCLKPTFSLHGSWHSLTQNHLHRLSACKPSFGLIEES